MLEVSQSTKNLKETSSVFSPGRQSQTTMMKTSTSGFLQTLTAEEAVKKTKMREAKMMLGLLRNEDIRNSKIQKQDDQYRRFMLRLEEKKRESESLAKRKNEERR